MKTVILTSSGFLKPKVRAAILPYLPSRRPLNIGYVSTASKVVKDDTYARRDVEIMKDLGFRITEIDLAAISSAQLQSLLPDQEAVYVQGGNGFYLLKHARRTGFVSLVRDLVNEGRMIYIGKSAGSYLACPAIDVHTWHSDKWRRFDVEDFRAMHLVSFLVQAHYSPEDNEAIVRGMRYCSYPLKLLTNDQALVVQGNDVALVGEGSENLYPFTAE